MLEDQQAADVGPHFWSIFLEEAYLNIILSIFFPSHTPHFDVCYAYSGI